MAGETGSVGTDPYVWACGILVFWQSCLAGGW